MVDKNNPPVSTKSPEPLQMHVNHAEDVARRERAIRIVMSRKGVDYPEAVALIDAEGDGIIDTILTQLDGGKSAPPPAGPAKVGAPDHDDLAAVQARADGATQLAQDALATISTLQGMCNRLDSRVASFESRIVALENAAKQPKPETPTSTVQ